MPSDSIGVRWRTSASAPLGAPPTRWVGESGVRSSGMLLLEVLELAEQAVVLGVADLRRVLLVVEAVGALEARAQLGGARLLFLGARAGSPPSTVIGATGRGYRLTDAAARPPPSTFRRASRSSVRHPCVDPGMLALGRALRARRHDSQPSRDRASLPCVGLAIAWNDSQPTWDDTGITAGLLVMAAALFGVIDPRRWWLWALLIGVGTPLLEIGGASGSASLAAFVFSGVGAAGGAGARRLLRSDRDASELEPPARSRWRQSADEPLAEVQAL